MLDGADILYVERCVPARARPGVDIRIGTSITAFNQRDRLRHPRISNT